MACSSAAFCSNSSRLVVAPGSWVVLVPDLTWICVLRHEDRASVTLATRLELVSLESPPRIESASAGPAQVALDPVAVEDEDGDLHGLSTSGTMTSGLKITR